jgi:hypothetical protein
MSVLRVYKVYRNETTITITEMGNERLGMTYPWIGTSMNRKVHAAAHCSTRWGERYCSLGRA